MKKRKIKKRSLAGIILLLVLAVSGLAMGMYVQDYYHASEAAMALVEESERETGIEIHSVSDTYVFEADDPVAGVIYSPAEKYSMNPTRH